MVGSADVTAAHSVGIVVGNDGKAAAERLSAATRRMQGGLTVGGGGTKVVRNDTGDKLISEEITTENLKPSNVREIIFLEVKVDPSERGDDSRIAAAVRVGGVNRGGAGTNIVGADLISEVESDIVTNASQNLGNAIVLGIGQAKGGGASGLTSGVGTECNAREVSDGRVGCLRAVVAAEGSVDVEVNAALDLGSGGSGNGSGSIGGRWRATARRRIAAAWSGSGIGGRAAVADNISCFINAARSTTAT